ncbi:M48 family metallopeptidase [Roseomonas terrae]|jgi:heat shock protein HtpX|uniref:M48 family metallopeptidase n=1 Tax=Neoroseomonas terrae TaxID=424799 RepID=A0ABS5EHC4_9PROT|nr:M48 family metallopeptidase [Neoroseomonas terrae]MBR0650422.1 M48 family metallopeptidase [Neoroseomonas terrae]
MQAFGLRTHAWNTALRSMLLLAGFPLLLAVVALGLGLIVGGEQHDLGRAFRNALRNLPLLYLMCWGAALVWFAIAWVAHNRILDWATGAHPVTRAEEPRLWNLLENLCISRGMRMPRLAIIETPAMNAYAAGLSRETGSVTVTRGLMNALDDRELAAVLAHELAHIRNGDARLGLIAAVFVGVISLGFDMMTRTRRVARAGRGWRVNTNSRNAGWAAIIGVLMIALAWGLATVLRMALSRNREFLADSGAVELTSDPDAMITALRKVEGNADMPEVSPQVRALFLEDASDSALSSLMATHPPIGDRVAALVKFAGGRDPGPIAVPPPAAEPPAQALPEAMDETVRISDGAAPSPATWWTGPAQGGGPTGSPWAKR